MTYRITQDALEVVEAGSAEPIHVTQDAVEIVEQHAAPVRITQDAIEIVIGTLTITSACPLPPAHEGEEYSYQFTAEGGSPPYAWTITGGELPDGLTMSGTGLISGTPTQSGRFSLTVQVS